jgi:pyrimidine deaminase RibD-like protein
LLPEPVVLLDAAQIIADQVHGGAKGSQVPHAEIAHVNDADAVAAGQQLWYQH